MKRIFNKMAIVLAGSLLLAGCISLSKEPPPSLLNIQPDAKPVNGASWSGTAASALVIEAPSLPRKLDTDRVPVQIDAANVAYLKDASWVEKPDRLFQNLLAETISSAGNRLILDPFLTSGKQAETLSGQLVDFGVNAQEQQVVIIYDAVWQKGNGQIIKRRFQASEGVNEIAPADVGKAMNVAANRLAGEVAAWIK